MAITFRAPAALSVALLSAVVLTGCTSAAPREFCVIGDEIATLEELTAFNEFAAILSAPAATDEYVTSVSDSADAAAGEFGQLSELVAEAAKATEDEATTAAFEKASIDFGALESLLADTFGSVSDQAALADVSAEFLEGFQAIVENPESNDAFSTVDDTLYELCGVAAGGVEERNYNDAKSDVALLGKEIATYAIDAPAGLVPDIVTIVDGEYLVAGVEVGAVSKDVELVTSHYFAGLDWCVEVRGVTSDITLSYSAVDGLADKPCAGASVG